MNIYIYIIYIIEIIKYKILFSIYYFNTIIHKLNISNYK